MALKLVVTQDFGDYVRGQEITDPETVAALQETHAAHVVRVAVPDPETAKGKAVAPPTDA